MEGTHTHTHTPTNGPFSIYDTFTSSLYIIRTLLYVLITQPNSQVREVWARFFSWSGWPPFFSCNYDLYSYTPDFHISQERNGRFQQDLFMYITYTYYVLPTYENHAPPHVHLSSSPIPVTFRLRRSTGFIAQRRGGGLCIVY